MDNKIAMLSPAAEAWRPLEATVPRIPDLQGSRVVIMNNRAAIEGNDYLGTGLYNLRGPFFKQQACG